MTAKLAAKLTTATTRLTDREKGASALEYVGMVVIAALIIGFVYTALTGADIGGKLKSAVDAILSGHGTSEG